MAIASLSIETLTSYPVIYGIAQKFQAERRALAGLVAEPQLGGNHMKLC